MTGYPGDEHVFSVVVIVLARSPDCNLRNLVLSLCPCSFAALYSLRLECASPSWHSVYCECVNCVLVSSLSSSVPVSLAHSQTAVDKLRYSCKADNVFTTLVYNIVDYWGPLYPCL